MSTASTCSSADIGKLGVEIELLAPVGVSREDLAHVIANRCGGTCKRFFHPQSEPSKVANTPVFENLTLGVVVEDREGCELVKCVDDLTLQDDLNPDALPKAGWYRIVSDDLRFLRLAMRHCDGNDPLDTVLNPLAEIFGREAEREASGMVRIADESDSAIVLGAPLPGERERPCEIVTSPISENHHARLEEFLQPARELGFTIPAEGAIHLHFDAAPLCSPATFGNLVRFFGIHSDEIKARFKTNPRCTRLGNWPVEIFDLITAPDFLTLSWSEAKERLREIKLVKFCDYNLANMILEPSGKHTFEVRIFPVWMDSGKIIEAASFFAQILAWAKDNNGVYKRIPDHVDELFSATNEA